MLPGGLTLDTSKSTSAETTLEPYGYNLVNRSPQPSPIPCRYLEDDGYCAYWDMQLRGNEDLRCYPGGWECYEEPGGIAYMGRWVDLWELLPAAANAPVSEYADFECVLEMLKPYWIDLLTVTKSQIIDPPHKG